MSGNRPGEAVKFDQHSALIDGALLSLGGGAREKAPTSSEDGRYGKLGVFFPCRRVRDRAVANDPIIIPLFRTKITGTEIRALPNCWLVAWEERQKRYRLPGFIFYDHHQGGVGVLPLFSELPNFALGSRNSRRNIR